MLYDPQQLCDLLTLQLKTYMMKQFRESSTCACNMKSRKFALHKTMVALACQQMTQPDSFSLGRTDTHLWYPEQCKCFEAELKLIFLPTVIFVSHVNKSTSRQMHVQTARYMRGRHTGRHIKQTEMHDTAY